MAYLHLESDTGEDAPQWIRDLRPSSSQLKIPIYPEVCDPKDPWAVKEEISLEDVIAAIINQAEKKKMQIPIAAPQGLAILLTDAATQTEGSKGELGSSMSLLVSRTIVGLGEYSFGGACEKSATILLTYAVGLISASSTCASFPDLLLIRRDLPRDIPLDSVVVLRYEKRSKSENKGKVSTKMELVLEQTQQGTSYEVSVSAERVEEFKRKVKIKGKKKEALLILRQKPGQYICCQESQR
ncbi:hypothetical protein Tco_1020102 [Tanacetum coccineum]|uniref:PH domain-containing protein n=1 Tax=Tanacetum coccineum TaxID=301880 RepID=A0ABQ5G0X7_9ASTR